PMPCVPMPRPSHSSEARKVRSRLSRSWTELSPAGKRPAATSSRLKTVQASQRRSLVCLDISGFLRVCRIDGRIYPTKDAPTLLWPGGGPVKSSCRFAKLENCLAIAFRTGLECLPRSPAPAAAGLATGLSPVAVGRLAMRAVAAVRLGRHQFAEGRPQGGTGKPRLAIIHCPDQLLPVDFAARLQGNAADEGREPSEMVFGLVEVGGRGESVLPGRWDGNTQGID